MEDSLFQGDFTKSAKFNQGVFQQQRLNDCMKGINLMESNPLGFNDEYNNFNYIIIFNNLNSLLSEISPKLKKEDLDDIKKWRSLIQKYITFFPVYEKIPPTMYGQKSTTIFNSSRWGKIESALYEFKNKIYGLMEKHGFGNPDKKNPYHAGAQQ